MRSSTERGRCEPLREERSGKAAPDSASERSEAEEDDDDEESERRGGAGRAEAASALRLY
jgi:hypothetical protein